VCLNPEICFKICVKDEALCIISATFTRTFSIVTKIQNTMFWKLPASSGSFQKLVFVFEYW
jgi:hypothetical protein